MSQEANTSSQSKLEKPRTRKILANWKTWSQKNEDSDNFKYITAEQPAYFPLTGRWEPNEKTQELWFLLLAWQKATNPSVSHQTFSNSIFKQNTDVAFHCFKIKTCPEKKRKQKTNKTHTHQEALIRLQWIIQLEKQRYLSEFPLIMRACKFKYLCMQQPKKPILKFLPHIGSSSFVLFRFLF